MLSDRATEPARLERALGSTLELARIFRDLGRRGRTSFEMITAMEKLLQASVRLYPRLRKSELLAMLDGPSEPAPAALNDGFLGHFVLDASQTIQAGLLHAYRNLET